ncbi:hypothetical protein KP509_13G063800 [Ceratopteris richardii]|nr:hypothetical protein KP509_13G063800 [Ceratopteris richardii]
MDMDHGNSSMQSPANVAAFMDMGGGIMPSMQMMTMMQMSFYWGKQVTILFSEWKTTTVGNYIGSLIALFIVAFLNQYLDRLTSSSSPLLLRSQRSVGADGSGGVPLESKLGSKNLGTNEGNDLSTMLQQRRPCVVTFLITALFFVRVSVSYLLMLAVMSFNGGVFLAVMLGFALGFFVFRTDIYRRKESSTPIQLSAVLHC